MGGGKADKVKGSLLELNDHFQRERKLHFVSDADVLDISGLVTRAVAAITRLIVYLEAAKDP